MHKAVSATGLRVIGVSGCKDAQLKAEIEKMGLPILTEGKEKAPRPAPAPQAPAQNTTPVTKNAFNRYPGAFRSAYLCSTNVI
ncbi:septum formation inhibitor [Escherichia coli]|uniref:Septum formation inhibitor n=1 Tax=Escherichia coli TaxID=562 RepID=A0A2X3LU95_ECOLX|nr:septum formation inhibitor [Escherichia coli]